MTIRQQGGVFGRNPSFNDVDVQDLTAQSVDINGGNIDGTSIGASAPAPVAGTTGRFGDLLKVNTGTEPDVVPSAGTVALFQRNTFSYSGSAIGLLAGVNGPCDINFGDTADQDVGQIRYNCATNVMEFRTAAALGFTLSSNGNIAFPSGQGIDFSATSGTGTSELFDDYEEGTWTPEITGTSTAGTIAYNAQHGYYTKIGRLVQVEFYVQWNSGTGTGNLQVTGLPFTAGNNLTQPGLAIGDIENVALTAGNIATLAVASNSTNINLRQIPTGGGGSSPAPYDAAGYIKASGVYSV